MITLSSADKELLEVAARPGGLHVYPGCDYRTDVETLTRMNFLRAIRTESGYMRWHITEAGKRALNQ